MLYYRSAEDQPFEKIIKTTWKDNFQILGFNYQSKNENDAYVLTNTTSDTNEIVLYDLKKKPLKRSILMILLMLENEQINKRDYEVDYFYYNGGEISYYSCE